MRCCLAPTRTFRDWVIAFLIGVVMFLIVEAEKVLTRRWRKTEV
jgi:hypothetical protein